MKETITVTFPKSYLKGTLAELVKAQRIINNIVTLLAKKDEKVPEKNIPDLKTVISNFKELLKLPSGSVVEIKKI